VPRFVQVGGESINRLTSREAERVRVALYIVRFSVSGIAAGAGTKEAKVTTPQLHSASNGARKSTRARFQAELPECERA
jgi:hypothetical protein